jgi:uncharacterized DUF497 family protein
LGSNYNEAEPFAIFTPVKNLTIGVLSEKRAISGRKMGNSESKRYPSDHSLPIHMA